jgi:hypothetical protein
MAIYHKLTHTLYGVLSGKRKWPYQLYLCFESILFFSFFISKLEHLIFNLITTITMIIIQLHHLVCTNLAHIHH